MILNGQKSIMNFCDCDSWRTILNWAKEGDFPLLYRNDKPFCIAEDVTAWFREKAKKKPLGKLIRNFR